MTNQPPSPPRISSEQVLRENIRSLTNVEALVAIGLTLDEIARGVHYLERTTGAVWERLDDDKSVSARQAERVKRWCRQVRSQVDALEREMDKYQP